MPSSSGRAVPARHPSPFLTAAPPSLKSRIYFQYLVHGGQETESCGARERQGERLSTGILDDKVVNLLSYLPGTAPGLAVIGSEVKLTFEATAATGQKVPEWQVIY